MSVLSVMVIAGLLILNSTHEVFYLVFSSCVVEEGDSASLWSPWQPDKVNPLQQEIRERKPDSSQWYPEQEQVLTGANRNKGNSFKR